MQVHSQTPGGAATFVGYRDRTPGLILSPLESNAKDDQSTHSWLSASPAPHSSSHTAGPLPGAAATGKHSVTVLAVVKMSLAQQLVYLIGENITAWLKDQVAEKSHDHSCNPWPAENVLF